MCSAKLTSPKGSFIFYLHWLWSSGLVPWAGAPDAISSSVEMLGDRLSPFLPLYSVTALLTGKHAFDPVLTLSLHLHFPYCNCHFLLYMIVIYLHIPSLLQVCKILDVRPVYLIHCKHWLNVWCLNKCRNNSSLSPSQDHAHIDAKNRGNIWIKKVVSERITF